MGQVYVSDHPLVQHKLTLLRDISTEPKRFRELLKEITWLLLYEATRDLKVEEKPVTTPLGTATGVRIIEEIAFCPILRAGLGMIEPALELIPRAQVWHIGIYRDHKTLKPIEYYTSLPEKATAQVAIILDPMLATGGSAAMAGDLLKSIEVPRIKFVGVIAAPEGIKKLHQAHPDIDIFVAAVDKYLTPEPQKPGDPPAGYIVPGLGDAGDRQFRTG
ncbi:MAG: uracil phosphoribosyltransferase [Anaerolineae bacterium]|nr:uracil phosphoribosyltransferase [Anaerolineae bacterium]MDW8102684.1 uracil phosphoribosyltransferase [Anaerolineae bacterium]